MWRLDKEQLTKVIVAEQTFTVWNSNLEVFRNKFCFSLDRKLIHITFKEKSGKIKTTLCFDSLDLSSHKAKFNYTARNITPEDCDPVMYSYSSDPELGYSEVD